ncbi:serine/threonine-protein kinase [Nocardiopsis alba]|uniref:Serine/threonine-protein kinase n=1 Tax=Nocardiopsis alba TaxID=53437 RepID=A0ABV5DR34_9ACTN
MSTSPMPAEAPVGLSPLKEGDPTDIGPYRLVGRIGAGGMGAVYGALDTYGRCVAVKTVRADLAAKPSFREAFAHEVAMLARADGVSTARLYAHDTEARVPWLAFDHVPGRDLRAHVREFGPLEGEMLRVFALGMAEGLAALHAAGVVHRDVKPANVILSPDGPKIVDFGIAAPIGTERSEDAFADHGTPGWAAPERHAGAIADSAADVFAWGALVAMAATGRQPFGKGETKERIRRVCAGEYEIDGVPEDLLPLVEGALSMEPGERPGAADLVRALLPEDRRDEEVGRALRRMLGDYWRGVDAAGHDPARWAAWLGGASATALGATGILGGAVGTGGAATGGAAGSSAAASGTTGATASGSSSGGILGGLAGSKVTMIGAGALAAAGVAAGGFVVYDLVSENPSETVAAAVNVLEDGEGFTAQVTRSFSQANAEQISEHTGTPVDQVMENSLTEEEYLYSAVDRTFLIEGSMMGSDTTAVANRQGDLYLYAQRESGTAGWWPETERPVLDPSIDTESVAVTLVTAPLRALTDTDEVEVVDERVYEGPTVLGLLEEGVFTEAEATVRVELDETGALLGAEYTTDQWDVRIDFDELDIEVPLEDPQVWDIENGRGWKVVYAPICGSIIAGAPVQREWDVQAGGWAMDCEYAMDIAEVMADPEEHQDRHVLLWGEFVGGATRAIDETLICDETYLDEDTAPLEHGVSFGVCSPISELIEPEGVDGSSGSGYHDAELEDETLIEFHERT